MKLYQIQDSKKKTFAKSGKGFSKVGKMWTSASAFHNHLRIRLGMDSYGSHFKLRKNAEFSDWRIREIELDSDFETNPVVNVYNFVDYVLELIDRKTKQIGENLNESLMDPNRRFARKDYLRKFVEVNRARTEWNLPELDIVDLHAPDDEV